MAQKWYSKATVQAALIGGIFLLAASLITVIMNKSNTIDKNKIISSNTNLNTNSNSNDILNIPDSLKTKNSSNEYELIFVIDITASMQPFIDGLAKSIVDLRNTLSSSYKDINLKIGVIIFRDYISNQSVMGLPFEIYTELSSDLSLVYQKLDTLREVSVSSEEYTECVFDALHLAISKTKWANNSNRSIILIGDAPSHELGYTKNTHGYSAELIVQEAAAKKIRLNAISIQTIGELNKIKNKQYKALCNGVNPALSGKFYNLGDMVDWSQYRKIILDNIFNWIKSIKTV